MEEAFPYLEEICNKIGVRRPGTDGEKKAVSYIEKKLKEFGYNVRKEEFKYTYWDYRDYFLEVTYPERREIKNALPLWGSRGGEIEGEIVFVGMGGRRKTSSLSWGKIALSVRGGYTRMEKYSNAIEAKALGLLYMHNRRGNLLEAGIVSDSGYDEDGIPAFSITKEEGDKLIEFHDSGGARGRLFLEVEVSEKTSWNLIATLDHEMEEKVVLGTHYDSWYVGAVDNATGMSVLLSVAESLAQEELEGIEVCFFGCGEIGGVGLKEHIKNSIDEITGIKAYLGLDSLAHRWGKRAVYCDRRSKWIAERISSVYPMELKHLSREMYTYSQVKIPSIVLGSSGDYPYYHTLYDTPEKVDRVKLELDKLVFFSMAQELASV